jgi:hypothetical protein
MFFERAGPVWETLRALEQRLHDAGIDYLVIGGLALNAFDYPRQTVDVDVVLRPSDFDRFKKQLVGPLYRAGGAAGRRFVDPQTDVSIDILLSGEIAGRQSKNPTVRFPDPAEAEVHGDLRTVSPARLIELKLVTWRFKEWGDVVELIRRNHLPDSFGEQLDPIVRTAYQECFDQANDPEYGGP